MKKLFVFLFIVVFAISIFADEATERIERIKTIQNALRDTNTWTPAITSMSRLSTEEMKNRCSLYFKPNLQKIEQPVNFEAYTPSRGKKTLINKMQPVRDQANCGSCWAFAMVAAVEAEHHNGSALDLSEQHLVSCCTSCMGCNGGYISSTASWVKSNGVATEASFPYIAKDGDCKDIAANWKETRKTISDYKGVGFLGMWADGDTMKAIDQGHVVVCGFTVYKDFMDYSGGVYRHVDGEQLGGHAVVIVGYNSDEKYWIVRNSWGTDWGGDANDADTPPGYFKIAFGECSIPRDGVYLIK